MQKLYVANKTDYLFILNIKETYEMSLLKVSKQVYARCTYTCPYEWFNGQRVTIIGHQMMHIIDNNCCCPRQNITTLLQI